MHPFQRRETPRVAAVARNYAGQKLHWQVPILGEGSCFLKENFRGKVFEMEAVLVSCPYHRPAHMQSGYPRSIALHLAGQVHICSNSEFF